MPKQKQTPADRRAGRPQRKPRDAGPDREPSRRSRKGPSDDLYDDDAVDADLDLEGGTYDGPPRR